MIRATLDHVGGYKNLRKLRELGARSCLRLCLFFPDESPSNHFEAVAYCEKTSQISRKNINFNEPKDQQKNSIPNRGGLSVGQFFF